MLILIPLLLAILALMYGSATSSHIQLDLFLKDPRNLFFRLGVSYEPLEDYKDPEGNLWAVSYLVIGTFFINAVVTFYTPKKDDTTTQPTNTTLLS